MIKESVGDGSEFGLEVYYSEEKNILGTGGGIKAAQKLLGEDTFLVINGDVIANVPLGDVWEHHLKTGGAATLVVKDDPSIPGWGDVKIDEKGLVRQILGKPKFDMPLKPRLFIGIQVLEPVFFTFLQPGVKASSTNDFYPAMLEKGLTIHSYEYSGYFLDIGTPERYQRACASKLEK
jgi:NDP-sugar pyrophosphorylase family protein